MMTLKNRMLLLLVAFVLTCMPLAAQPPRGPHRPHMEQGGGKFDLQKIKREVEQFITVRAGLTPDEARRFFPMFHEYKRQHRDLRGKIRRAIERVDGGRLTEQDAHRILNEVRRMRRQQSELDSEAFARFERILPPKKLLKVIQADQELRRKMFEKGPRH